MNTPRLVLASASRYRAELLQRLLVDFECAAPDIDETALTGEAPAARAVRLATCKARAVAKSLDRGVLIIGSDQVAELDGRMLDKPGSVPIAHAQLAASSGRTVHFHTAACVLDARTQREHVVIDFTGVRFRHLDAITIARYIKREQPLDCAGSFKCEGLGISLFEHIDSRDPTALVGLPLIALARMLRDCGLLIP